MFYDVILFLTRDKKKLFDMRCETVMVICYVRDSPLGNDHTSVWNLDSLYVSVFC
jgi:hypothetical protein